MNLRIALSAAMCALVLTACTDGAATNTEPPRTTKAEAPVSGPTGQAEEPAQEGFVGYVVRSEGDRLLVISPTPQDFSANGGMNHYYEAIWYSNMPSDIEPGMKVKVWAQGAINESYPAQGQAARAEVIAAAKPEGALLSEVEAIREAIASYEKADEGITPVVTDVKYDPSSTLWTISITNNGAEETVAIEVQDREKEPDLGELYGLALNAFISIDDGLNSGMKYIAVDMSNFESIDGEDKQQIVNALSGYDVPVKGATYEELRAEEVDSKDPKSIGLDGILLRVDKVELTDRRMVLEGSKFKSGKAAIGTKVIVEQIGGQWQVTQADGTWIS